MMSNCQHYRCGCHTNGCTSGCSYCPYPEWLQPICHHPTHYCCAGSENGPTLVIHKIILEAGGSQSCTPRTISLRITGPSYPCGEVFTLRAGSCTELDEPLVIAGLIPGQYTIEELHACRNTQTSTLTGPVCGNTVNVTDSPVPTVITIVSRLHPGRCCACRHSCTHGCGW